MLYFIGIDLAWAEKAKPNESGIVMLDQAGTIVSAGWAVGIDEAVAWLDLHAPSDALLFVDAPLVVNNASPYFSPGRLSASKSSWVSRS